MPKTISVTQAHTLGRMEAKKRMEAMVAGYESRFNLGTSWQEEWEKNVLHFKSKGGETGGIVGYVTVRNNYVDYVVTLPDNLVRYSAEVEAIAQQDLINWVKQ